MRQHVVGIERGDAISDLDGFVELLRVLVNPRQAVHGVEEGRIGGDGSFVLPDSFLVMPLSVQIERRVVMVFRGLAGLVVGHPAFRGSGLSLAGCSVLGEAEEWAVGKTGRHADILIAAMHYILRFLWNATRGHRLAPWRSPYLRWRIETYTGIKMQSIGFLEFFGFTWRERVELFRFLKWTGEMERYARVKPKNP